MGSGRPLSPRESRNPGSGFELEGGKETGTSQVPCWTVTRTTYPSEVSGGGDPSGPRNPPDPLLLVKIRVLDDETSTITDQEERYERFPTPTIGEGTEQSRQ